MVRLIRHDRDTPYLVKTKSGENMYVCACGLSSNKPFCDGSHKRTQDEQSGEVYLYEEDGRIRLTPSYPQATE